MGGMRVGAYVVSTTLGEGTFGKVRLATHSQSGVEYAIKVLDKSAIHANELADNVRREIAIMKALNHRNIVNLREVLSSRSKLYIVMDLVRGGELFEEIERTGDLNIKVARSYFQQLVDGVEYCHRRGVYHRDLKPENLLVDGNGTLKITDFGVSSMTTANQDLLYTACGTPFYCAPEIISNSEGGYSGAKVDAWSSGVILFLLLTGNLPFFNNDMNKLYQQIDECNVEFPQWLDPSARDLISKLLTRDPAKRYSLADVRGHEWFLVDYKGDFPTDTDAIESQPQNGSTSNSEPEPSAENFAPPLNSENSETQPQQPSTRLAHASSLPPMVPDQPKLGSRSSRGAATAPMIPPGSEIAAARVRAIVGSEATSAPTPAPSSAPAPAPSPSPAAISLNPVKNEAHVPATLPTAPSAPVPKLSLTPIAAKDSGAFKDLSRYDGEELTTIIKDALPGKSAKRVAKVVDDLAEVDVECCEDLIFLAKMLESASALSSWLEEKSTLPALTCMRIAAFFFE